MKVSEEDWTTVRQAARIRSVGWRDGDDVTQDAFLVALERGERVADPIDFAGRVANRMSLKARMRAAQDARRATVVDIELNNLRAPEPVYPPEDIRAVEQLDPLVRELLLEHHVDGLSARELAELYGVNRRRVQRWLDRAADMLAMKVAA